MSKLSKIAIAVSSLVLATISGFLAMQMLQGLPMLQAVFGAFLIWVFGAVPLLFLYVTRKEKK